MFEEEGLFVRGLGEATDVVEKEMFQVSRIKQDSEEEKRFALRPENTAGVVRAYIENGMASWPQPVKLWYAGPQFRADRPQKGRLRQFTQFGYEVLGDDDPATDALVILLTKLIFDDLKLSKDLVIEVNTLGGRDCRSKVVKTIKEYFTKYESQLCDDCKRRLQTNPLRLLDCKEAGCERIKQGAPQLPDIVCPADRKHFQTVLNYLDAAGVTYDLNPFLVRGFDYYTRTTFEVREQSDTTRQSSLGGGGRYDNLIETYGGAKTPAIGFSGGVERIVEKLKSKQVAVPEPAKPQAMVISIGEAAKKQAIKVVADLSAGGVAVTMAPAKESLKAQLRLADKLVIALAIIIGQKEVYDRSAIVRVLDAGTQEIVKLEKLASILKEKLA
ncbi:histidine--tRNA ligase [Candidatus Berkelbacteria bacterium]|nr:histidine--tRNA ligase [Candidatus Berkelbacteria bacterium]